MRIARAALVPCLLALASMPEGRGAAPPDRARTDCYGDPLPPGAFARIGTVRWRHVGATQVAWLGNGALASLAQGNLRVWDVATGRVAREVQTSQDEVDCWALSADGKLLALASPTGDVNIYDASSGKPVRRIKTGWGSAWALAFSPDGKRLAAGSSGFEDEVDSWVGIWEVSTAKRAPTLQGPRASDVSPFVGGCGPTWRSGLTFSPNGTRLACAASSGLVYVWHTANGKHVWHRKVDRRGAPSPLAFSPDGKLLAWVQGTATICIGNASTGKVVLTWRYPESFVLFLAFSPDGKLLASVHEHAVRLWDARTGKPLRRLEGAQLLSFAAFSPDGKSIASAAVSCVRRWDVVTGKEVLRQGRDLGAVVGLAVSAEGKTVVTGAWDGRLLLSEAHTGRPLRWLDGDAESARPLALSPDGKALAVAGDEGRVVLWGLDTSKGKELVRRGPNTLELAFSADGNTLVLADGEGSARSLSLPRREQPRERLRLLWKGRSSDWSALSAHGCCLAVWGKSEVQAGGVFTGRRHPRFRSGGQVGAIAVSPDGRVVAVFSRPRPAMDEPPNRSRPVLWTASLVEVVTGKERRRWQFRAASEVWPAVFGPNGDMLAFATGQGSQVREAETGKQLALLHGHQGEFNSLAFSADGRSLVSASIDTTALVWKVPRVERAPRVDLSPRQREALWANLADADAARAGRAITALSRERSPAFLERRLRQEARASARRSSRFVRLTADLGSADFTTREQATRALREGTDDAEPALHRALAGKLDLEARLRLTKLLAERDGAAPSPGWARVVRALEALERMGGPEARQALDAIAREGDGPLAEEARAARARLAARPPR